MQTAAREIVWGVKPIEYWGLCITAEEPGAVITMSNKSYSVVSLEYSRTGSTWRPFMENGSCVTSIRLENVGDKCYFRAASGGNNSLNVGAYGNHSFNTSKKVSIKGKVSSLLNRDVEEPSTISDSAFACLFGQNSIAGNANSPAQIVDASELILPSVTSSECYRNMFCGCRSLVNAPELPATTLAERCYLGMFYMCKSLVNAPELPATTLAERCYYYMCGRCTSLVNAPELPATTLAEYCYSLMFVDCTSLVNAPELPATTLAYSCYSSLFKNCNNIKNIRTKQTSFKTPDGKSACKNWLTSVSSIGTFECPSVLGTNETIERGTSACPSGWTVKNI